MNKILGINVKVPIIRYIRYKIKLYNKEIFEFSASGDGVLDKSEFLANRALNAEHKSSNARVVADSFFTLLDRDTDGKFTVSDVRKQMTSQDANRMYFRTEIISVFIELGEFSQPLFRTISVCGHL